MFMLLAESTTSMSDALGNIFTLVPQVLSVISSNAVMMTFFCAGVIGIAIGIVKKLRG